MTNHTESSNAGYAAGGDDVGADTAESRARNAASETGNAAWEEAQAQFEQQRSFVAEQANKVASALHNMAREFDQQDQHAFSNYTNRLASYSDALSEKLRDKDLNYFVDEARSISRRQPLLFVGGAIAAGFVLARFLRSSAAPQQPAHRPDSVPTSRTGHYDAPATQAPSPALGTGARRTGHTDAPIGKRPRTDPPSDGIF